MEIRKVIEQGSWEMLTAVGLQVCSFGLYAVVGQLLRMRR